MKIYTSENPPKQGNGKRIWKALNTADLMPLELQYNPNCWGKGHVNGWGTWACELKNRGWFFCGVSNGIVYVQSMTAPYNKSAIRGIQ